MYVRYEFFLLRGEIGSFEEECTYQITLIDLILKLKKKKKMDGPFSFGQGTKESHEGGEGSDTSWKCSLKTWPKSIDI